MNEITKFVNINDIHLLKFIRGCSYHTQRLISHRNLMNSKPKNNTTHISPIQETNPPGRRQNYVNISQYAMFWNKSLHHIRTILVLLFSYINSQWQLISTVLSWNSKFMKWCKINIALKKNINLYEMN